MFLKQDVDNCFWNSVICILICKIERELFDMARFATVDDTELEHILDNILVSNKTIIR